MAAAFLNAAELLATALARPVVHARLEALDIINQALNAAQPGLDTALSES